MLLFILLLNSHFLLILVSNASIEYLSFSLFKGSKVFFNRSYLILQSLHS